MKDKKNPRSTDIVSLALLLLCSAFLLQPSPALAKKAPSQPAATLTLTSEPTGAAVTIDKIPSGATPTTTPIEAGQHLVEMRLENYKPAFINVTVTADSPAEHVKLEPITASVLVHSTPAGATVTRDGANIGLTPLLMPELPIGSYRIEVALDGYKPQQLDLSVTSGKPQRINADLASSSATLEIVSEPAGADVSVNGIARGKAPITVDKIPEGLSSVEISSPGFKTYREQVRLVAGEKFTLNAPLEAIPAELSIVTIPAGARIYLDNQFKGESPITFENLPAGEYRIRAEKESHEIMARTITLANAQSATEEFRLTANVGGLILATSPAGVTVLVGGRDSGTTAAATNKTDRVSDPLEIKDIPIGQQEVVFFRKGYAEQKRMVEIKRNEVVTLETVQLIRQFIPDVEVTTQIGVYKGVFVDKTDELYRIETDPGVIRGFLVKDIKSVRLIREDTVDKKAPGTAE